MKIKGVDDAKDPKLFAWDLSDCPPEISTVAAGTSLNPAIAS